MRKLLILLVIFLHESLAQNQTKIVGYAISESSDTLIGALVSVKDLTLVTATDEKGYFEIADSGNIQGTLQILHEGYLAHSQTVFVPKGHVFIADFRLTHDITQLQEVVITAQYKPVTQDQSMYSVKVINSKKIEAMGAVTLRDVLTNNLNIRLAQDNVLGSSMSLQGIDGANVKILVDGVPMIGRLDGNIDLSQINLLDIDKIEIVEGPLSVQYGTNALAGTINIITKKHSKSSHQQSVSSQYESVGNYNLGLLGQYRIKKTNLSISLSRNYFDGWNPGDRAFLYIDQAPADSNRYQAWKPKEQYVAAGSISQTLKKNTITYKSSYFTEEIINRGKPLKPYNERAFDDSYFTQRIDNALNVTGHLKAHFTYNAIVSYNTYLRRKNSYVNDLTTLQKTLNSNSSAHDTSRFHLLMSRGNICHAQDSSKIKYEIGYDINVETAEGQRIENSKKQMGDYALYSTATYEPLKHIYVMTGLRYAFNTVYQAPLTPSLNIKYSWNERSIIRMSYARGFRAPSLKELYFYFVDINHNIIGSKNLKAETSHNLAFTFTHYTSLQKHKVQTDFNLFCNDIHNLITLANIAGTEYTYVNIGRYKTLGTQINTTYKYKQFQSSLGGSYVGRYNTLSVDYDLPTFNFSPEVVGNLQYKISKTKSTLSLFYKYNGKMPSFALDGEGHTQQRFIAAYQLLDATVQQEIYGNRILITIGCKNILNVSNIMATSTTAGAHQSSSSSMSIATGRNYFVKLVIQLNSEKK